MDTLNETEIRNDSYEPKDDKSILEKHKQKSYFWPICIIIFHVVAGFVFCVANCILLVMGLKFRSSIVNPFRIWIMLGVYIPLIYIWIKNNGMCKGVKLVVHIITGTFLFAIAPFILGLVLLFSTALDHPQHVAEVDGNTYIAEVHTWLDTCVYYYDYHGDIVMGSKKKMLGVFYDAGSDPYANGPEPTSGEADFYIYDKYGHTIDEFKVLYDK